MADNVPITAGTGTVIATDDVSGVQYQQVKLIDGTANSTAVIPGDATSGLFVNPKRSIFRIQVTPTVSTGIYASGDQLGSLMQLTNAARVAAGGGVLLGVTMLNKANVAGFAFDLLFFDRSVTVAADNAVATYSDADMAFLVGALQISATDYPVAFAGTPANYFVAVPGWNTQTPTVSTPRNGVLQMPYVASSTDIFCAAIVRGTPTLTTTTDLVFSFTVERY